MLLNSPASSLNCMTAVLILVACSLVRILQRMYAHIARLHGTTLRAQLGSVSSTSLLHRG